MMGSWVWPRGSDNTKSMTEQDEFNKDVLAASHAQNFMIEQNRVADSKTSIEFNIHDKACSSPLFHCSMTLQVA
jgi:hypothetical protein